MAVFLKVANKPCSIKPWKYSHRLIQIRIISLKIKNKDFFFSKKKKKNTFMSLKKEPLYRQVATRITGKRKQRKKQIPSLRSSSNLIQSDDDAYKGTITDAFGLPIREPTFRAICWPRTAMSFDHEVGHKREKTLWFLIAVHTFSSSLFGRKTVYIGNQNFNMLIKYDDRDIASVWRLKFNNCFRMMKFSHFQPSLKS